MVTNVAILARATSGLSLRGGSVGCGWFKPVSGTAGGSSPRSASAELPFCPPIPRLAFASTPCCCVSRGSRRVGGNEVKLNFVLFYVDG